MDEKLANKCMIVNAESNFWTVKEFLPSMMERDSGQIVAIASCAGKSGAGGLADYCASKFAQYGFNESLRVEMKILGKNINVTTICPWFINTGMFQGVNVGYLAPL
jgi:all-trans-retinol dehydrogenase (NAD+)